MQKFVNPSNDIANYYKVNEKSNIFGYYIFKDSEGSKH